MMRRLSSTMVVGPRRRVMTTGGGFCFVALVLISTATSTPITSTAAQSPSGLRDDSQRQQQQYTHQHAQRATETLAHWHRSLSSSSSASSSSSSAGGYEMKGLRPLDLVLDDPTLDNDSSSYGNDNEGRQTPKVYQRGDGGFLEPYDFNNYQMNEEQINVSNGLAPDDENDEEEEEEEEKEVVVPTTEYANNDNFLVASHVMKERIGITNLDIHRGIVHTPLSSDEEEEVEERRRKLLEGNQEENDRELVFSSSFNKRLRRRDVKNNNKDDEQNIVRSLKRREEEIFDFTHHDKTKKSYYESSSTAVVDTNTSPPVVRSTFPPFDTTIGPRQTFGALVSDHALSYTSGVEKVCVQFRDALGVRSTCLPLYNVGSGVSSSTTESRATSDVKCTKAEHRLSVDCLSSSSSSTSRMGGSKSDIWERTFDGFGAFAGTAWKYRIQAYDTRKNRIVTKWQSFNIDARAEVKTTTTTTTTTSTIAAATTTSTVGSSTTNCGEGNVGNGICPMAGDCCSKWGYCGVTSDHCGTSNKPATKLVDVVMDENWPYGGVVQTSTGRILFFFDGNPYVCSGTVIKDPAADRTIVLTAGHCAFQYQPSGGRFTEHALYIPNQVDTRGAVSDELCTNDPLGCWVPAFAVVHYEWTTKGFPHSVPWDYAYYVIPNDVSAHLDGFIHENQKDLSRILEEIVEPMPIDFNWRISSSRSSHLTTIGEFAHGLGYSFNRDPAFRYCASNTITKFGVPTYENLWLESCALTGGSSGGPWLKDTDTDGRGTVISINSWGYATVPGMAGPNFSTASGSKAECLFEVAKNTPFEDVVGKRGIVVDTC